MSNYLPLLVTFEAGLCVQLVSRVDAIIFPCANQESVTGVYCGIFASASKPYCTSDEAWHCAYVLDAEEGLMIVLQTILIFTLPVSAVLPQ